MKFGPVALDLAAGAILGHNVYNASGRRVLRKGAALDGPAIELLRALGRNSVYAAELEPGDVGEDAAALRIAEAVAGSGLRLAGPRTGRVNLHSDERGVVRVAVAALLELNRCSGVTLATLPDATAVRGDKIVGTIKILPYALPASTVAAAVAIGRRGPVVELVPLRARRVGLLVAVSRGAEERVSAGFATALSERLEALGSSLERVETFPADEEAAAEELARHLRRQVDDGLELVILAGETAIQDRFDLAPRALVLAGGEVTCFGAPVDPGNLLMLGYLGATPVLGAPGCARSPKRNIVDLLLPRLLLGERVGQDEIVALGHGGLLEDVPERPMPRSRV